MMTICLSSNTTKEHGSVQLIKAGNSIRHKWVDEIKFLWSCIVFNKHNTCIYEPRSLFSVSFSVNIDLVIIVLDYLGFGLIPRN